jgi:hypothetical protein
MDLVRAMTDGVGWTLLGVAGLVFVFNAVTSLRRAIRGHGSSSVPALITVLGLTGLRALSISRADVGGVSFGTAAAAVVVADIASWALAPLLLRSR